MTRLPRLYLVRGRALSASEQQKEYAMGDKGGKKDKDKNKNKRIKKREDKAAKAREKNQKPSP